MPCWFVPVFAALLTATSLAAAPASAPKSKSDSSSSAKSKEQPPEVHKVKRGETLWGIARLHGVSVGDIMDLNHLGDSTLREGQSLKIPPPTVDAALAPNKTTSHTVAKGETFRTISRKYGLTPGDLEKANPKMDADKLKPGVKVMIPAVVTIVDDPVTTTGRTESRTYHTVTEQDTFYTIAKKYGVTEAAVTAANPQAHPNRLRPGSRVVIPGREVTAHSASTAASADASDHPSIGTAARKTLTGPVPDEIADAPSPAIPEKPRSRRYVISADETPETICDAFDISLKKLYELNNLAPATPLKPGMEIQVPVR